MKKQLASLGVLACALAAAPLMAQQATPGSLDGPMTENPKYNGEQQKKKAATTESKTSDASKPPENSAPPRSDGESSSNQTHIDLSPPSMDGLAHPGGGHVGDDALKAHDWNPMRAMKDVEVGDYYYRNGNYGAALSRYREALEFKPRDAEATFKLAQVLEKTKATDEARTRYEEYLTILKDGPRAGEAKKALERLKK